MTDETDEPDRVPVVVDESGRDLLGLRVETVGREVLTPEVEAVAFVVPDESRLSHVHTRVSGWLESLDVKTTGESVHAGQALARIFSQELFASQVEYLAARGASATSGLTSAVVASGRTRLKVLGMTDEEIDAIEHSGEPRRLVTVAAPAAGVVIDRGVTEGTAVDPSTTLVTIADLSRVWVLAEVPEDHIPDVRSGMLAEVEVPASGRAAFTARADFLYPTLTEGTRTLRVRLPADNPGGRLRPGMYGVARFRVPGRGTLTVPREAVVDTGARQHVFVVEGDRFEPREVTLGTRLSDRVEVTGGLSEGEQIVTSGVFLIDSESRLRASGGTTGHDHGSMSDTTADETVDPAGAAEPMGGMTIDHSGH